MTSPQIQYNPKDLYNAAIKEEDWKEVRSIIIDNPQLVNEKHAHKPLVYHIVLHKAAPQDILLEILSSATEEAIEFVDEKFSECILHYLAQLGNVEALRLVLKKSPKPVNWRENRFGDTPLYWLLDADHIFQVHKDATQALLDAGADSHIKNKNGYTPMEIYAINECSKYDDKYQKIEILRLLDKAATTGTEPVEDVPLKPLEKGTYREEQESIKSEEKPSEAATTGTEPVEDVPLKPLEKGTYREEQEDVTIYYSDSSKGTGGIAESIKSEEKPSVLSGICSSWLKRRAAWRIISIITAITIILCAVLGIIFESTSSKTTTLVIIMTAITIPSMVVVGTIVSKKSIRYCRPTHIRNEPLADPRPRYRRAYGEMEIEAMEVGAMKVEETD